MLRSLLRGLCHLVPPASLALLGCAAGVGKVSIPVEPPREFSRMGERVAPERWWTAFGDSALDALVDSALAANFDLQSAWERLRAARAVVSREGAGLLPDIEATARGEKTRASEKADEFERLGLGVGAAWELDLWGRIRSGVDAERYRAEAALADYRAAALSLSAEIALTWYRLAEAGSGLALAEEQIETNETVETLLGNRFGTGQVRAVDILRQRQLVEAARERRALLESRRRVLQHRLAVLTGNPPQDAALPSTLGLPELPPLPHTGVPSGLVRRRPDVLAAFHRLQAADRDLAEAVRDQFPRLSFAVAASTSDGAAAGLFETWALSFVGNLIAPIFLGGELRAEVDRAGSVKRELLYAYGQTVLTAFQEVEDALIQEQQQAASLERLREQIRLGDLAYEQLRIAYLNGAGSYVDVLLALDGLQALRRDLLASERALVEHRIALYRALAGPVPHPEGGRDEPISAD